MALRMYKCKICGERLLAFDGEENRLECCYNNYLTNPSIFEKIYCIVRIVHTTDIFDLTQLDSIGSIHDLQEIRILRASQEREVKQLNEARKNI